MYARISGLGQWFPDEVRGKLGLAGGVRRGHA